ncbi:Veg family protein [Hathewaya limosa]|uniref:Uncharacterized protein Veg n=1 Tax=Hathewaya limosa TaxID=1536 RepID=A0ABU0JMR8_HATLI|nr:Veg family protein [Hathewaya limosa]MDQ0478369.1 uncharacterized protein Veg [Hathewaya limosa]
MEANNKLDVIKSEVKSHVGETVNLKDLGGRKKVLIEDGVLEKAYSSIFTVRVNGDFERRLTYSYSDILTNTVQIQYTV